MGVFSRAIERMATTGSAFHAPMSFQAYLTEAGLRAADTARHISVQSLADLNPELREAGIMVFRLGVPPGGKHTHFALARALSGWGDYFVLDHDVFAQMSPTLHCSLTDSAPLQAFSLLPKFTETSLVNLAVASGLLAKALSLDSNSLPSVPATGQGTYSFPFTPHSEIPTGEWQHIAGQVEIDAVFVGSRAGQKTVFVVEAKAGPPASLAKHKLAYPIWALHAALPASVSVVGVYLRSYQIETALHFLVAECQATLGLPLSSITTRGLGHYVIELPRCPSS